MLGEIGRGSNPPSPARSAAAGGANAEELRAGVDDLDISADQGQLIGGRSTDLDDRLAPSSDRSARSAFELAPPPRVDRRRRLGVLALLVLLAAVGVTAAFGLDADLMADAWRRHHRSVLGFVTASPVLASLLFMAVHAAFVAGSIPGGSALLTMIAGYLFGALAATAYVVIATMLAGVAVFLLVRSAALSWLPVRPMPLAGFAEAFRSHALSYVFLLHLVPIFPTAVAVGIPAACGVRLRSFVVSAMLGLVPGTLLLADLGARLGDVLLSGGPPGIASLAQAGIVLPLAGLAVLALLPVAWRRWSSRRSA